MPYEENMRERDEFFNTLYTDFINDDKIYVLYADIGCQGLDQFRNHHRCINMGIAEQNMVAVASGLALDGNRVYCFTIQAFYLRAVEQIKVLVNQLNLPIFLVGCGKDDYYKNEGFTHIVFEDKTIISRYHNITIWDGGDIKKLVEETLVSKTPYYIRLSN